MVEAADYTAEAASPGKADDGAAAEETAVRRLRRRLVLALVFFVPLTDLSVVLSVFPWTVPRLAVAAAGAGRTGGDLGGVAVPRCGAADRRE